MDDSINCGFISWGCEQYDSFLGQLQFPIEIAEELSDSVGLWDCRSTTKYQKTRHINIILNIRHLIPRSTQVVQQTALKILRVNGQQREIMLRIINLVEHESNVWNDRQQM